MAREVRGDEDVAVDHVLGPGEEYARIRAGTSVEQDDGGITLAAFPAPDGRPIDDFGCHVTPEIRESHSSSRDAMTRCSRRLSPPAHTRYQADSCRLVWDVGDDTDGSVQGDQVDESMDGRVRLTR